MTTLPAEVARKLRPFALPEATMRSLSTSLTERIVVLETRNLLGTDGQFEAQSVEKFTINPGMTKAELRQDLATVSESLQQAPESMTAKHVGLLKIRTKSRALGDLEARLLADTVVTDLRQYPADVVAYACQYWVEGGRENKWFPSWPELREICERRVRGRQKLKRALEWLVANAAE